MKTFWLFALVATACNADQAAKCSLHCLNDGECQIGKADFSAHPTKFHGISLEMHIKNEQNGYHCHCRPGYTGLRCGIKYQDCSDVGHACYNGGRCILGLSDIYGNDQLFCDCSTAIDENGTKYVGKYCEIPQTVSCDESGTFFCVNGGQCRPDYGNHPISPCICRSEYDGPHCEFEAGAVPECTLKCHNGGECRLGMKSELSSNGKILYDFWKNHSDYQYCECPTGFHGLQCEIKSSKCGMHHCFHGGECVTVNDGSTQKRFCDCSKAYSRVSSYAGEFCQYEADNVCDEKKTSNGQLFCVNGGVCRLDDSNLSCSCPKGYHGPICEFKDSNITNDFEDCNLVCANGGKCRNGAKDTSFWDKFGDALSHYSVSHDKNFEHCVCPEGFTGLTCEIKMTVCPQGNHVCLHGSKCTQGGNGKNASCDCEAGSSSFQMLAGKFCEYKSTTLCNSGSHFSFCVNDGECVVSNDDESESEPGCKCPNGFAGRHCEVRRQGSGENDQTDKTLVFEDKKETTSTTAQQSGHLQENAPTTEIQEESNKKKAISDVRPSNALPESSSKTDSDEASKTSEPISPLGVTGIVLVILIGLSTFGVLRYRNNAKKTVSGGDSRTQRTNESSQLFLTLPYETKRQYRDYLIPADDEIDNALSDEDVEQDPLPSSGLLLL